MQIKKNYGKIISSILFIMTVDCAIAQTDSVIAREKITGNAELNYRAKYLWRGSVFGNNYVSQPEINLAYKNFKIGLSSYFNLKPQTLSKELYTKQTYFDEQDVQLVYTKEIGKFALEGGLYNYFYFFQPASPNTTELGLNITYNLSSKINFFNQNAFGLRGYKNSFYSSIGIAYKAEIFKNTEIQYKVYTGAGNVIYNEAYFGIYKNAITYFGNQFTLTKNIKSFYLFVNGEANIYNRAVLKDIIEQKGNTNVSIGLGKTF